MSAENIRETVAYNRSRGDEFKRRVVLHMQDHGYPAKRIKTPGKVSEALRSAGDVDGLPVAVAIRTALTMDLSGLLTDAAHYAEASGKRWFVGIHSRRAHEIGDSYAVMPLDQLLEMLHLLRVEEAESD